MKEFLCGLGVGFMVGAIMVKSNKELSKVVDKGKKAVEDAIDQGKEMVENTTKKARKPAAKKSK